MHGVNEKMGVCQGDAQVLCIPLQETHKKSVHLCESIYEPKGEAGVSGNIIKTEDYKAFIQDIKRRIQTAQIKAAVAVNQELLYLYWDLAERIVTKQKQTAWGGGFIVQMSRDLREEFPGMKGFSERNLKYIRQWYLFYSCHEIGQQLVAQLTQIPWGHNIAIVSKSKNDTVVEYALKDVHKPIGVSEYIITRNLPDEFRSSLPSIEEIEVELSGGEESQ